MRTEFAASIIKAFNKYDNLVFITGDLGYLALESVAEALGSRFINAGVSEQNIISVAAGMAAQGLVPWVYSIAPFITLRPYEQIRNDVCFHNLPVKIVGNGGGYGYGIMGATHHVLQDIGCMRMLPNMEIFLPIFPTDVEEAVFGMMEKNGPGYLRLNLKITCTEKKQPFSAWRRLASGDKLVVIAAGPVVEEALKLVSSENITGIEVWSVGQFPYGELPQDLLNSLEKSRKLIVMDEHYSAGGLGEAIAATLCENNPSLLRKFKSVSAKGYPSNNYGSQKWHRVENGLSGAMLSSLFKEFITDESNN